MRRFTPIALAAAAAAATLAAVPTSASAGVTGAAFYVDGELYRTVATPTDLSKTGAPASSFDTIYQFAGAQPFNVAEAAPGDQDYNGGRWRVRVVGYSAGETYESALAAFDANGSGDFDSDAEVRAAITAGVITTSSGPSFVCPVVPLPANG
jgi:hypothetical protein